MYYNMVVVDFMVTCDSAEILCWACVSIMVETCLCICHHFVLSDMGMCGWLIWWYNLLCCWMYLTIANFTNLNQDSCIGALNACVAFCLGMDLFLSMYRLRLQTWQLSLKSILREELMQVMLL